MSKATRELKSKYNVKTLLTGATTILGLSVESKTEVAVADTPDAIVIRAEKGAGEWVIPKTNLIDIGLIHARDLNKVTKAAEGAAARIGQVASGIALSILTGYMGFSFTGIARSANNYCLLIGYANGGKNDILLLHLNPDQAAKFIGMVEDINTEWGNRFVRIDPFPDDIFAGNDYVSFGVGSAYGLLLEALEGRSSSRNMVAQESATEIKVPEPAAAPPVHQIKQPEPISAPSHGDAHKNEDESKKCCSNCGHEVGPEDAFCGYCGTRQEMKRFCRNCGKQLTPDAMFCQHCGTPVDQRN